MNVGRLIDSRVLLPHTPHSPAIVSSGRAGQHVWPAELRLRYAVRDAQTYLRHQSHQGPLAVQKSLYPEGPAVCHTLILHPPGGIVGGDALDVGIDLQAGSCALITMPGAAKWYRSAGRAATQHLRFSVQAGAALEWLPQETIVFSGAAASLHAVVDLDEGGSYVGWEIMCLGRSAAGERFDSGHVHQTTDISVAGELIWSDRGRLTGGSPLLESLATLAGAPISGIMVAVGKDIPPELLAQCRAVAVAMPARSGISAMPRILVARYVGRSCEQAKDYFIALWRQLRPFMTGRNAVLPRIWST